MARAKWSDIRKNASGGFEPLAIGEYDTEVTNCTHKVSSNGKDMFNVEFTVTAGPSNGRKAWSNFVVTPDNPNALGMFFAKMAAIGAGADFFDTDPENDEICARVVGAHARITVAHREYEGRTQSDVKKVVPLKGSGGGAAAPAPKKPAATGGRPDVPF